MHRNADLDETSRTTLNSLHPTRLLLWCLDRRDSTREDDVVERCGRQWVREEHGTPYGRDVSAWAM